MVTPVPVWGAYPSHSHGQWPTYYAPTGAWVRGSSRGAAMPPGRAWHSVSDRYQRSSSRATSRKPPPVPRAWSDGGASTRYGDRCGYVFTGKPKPHAASTHYPASITKISNAVRAPTTAPDAVVRVFDALHLVGPFLTTADLLSLAAVAKWLQPYRSICMHVTIGIPPDGMGSGHWTSLANLLANLKGLKSIKVAHTQSVFGLTKCLGLHLTPNVETLDLSHCKIWKHDENRLIDALTRRALPSLRRLVLCDTAIGDRGARSLATVLSSGACHSLEALDLGDNNLRGSLQDLAAALRGGCPNMKSLYLRGNALGRQGVAMLVQGLSTSTGGGGDGAQPASASAALLQLEELDLVETDLGPEGFEGLAIGLQDAAHMGGPLASLTTLRLNGNKAGNQGLEALASAMAAGAVPKLQMLDLGANYISCGVVALAEAFEYGACPSIVTLNMSFNFIDEEGLRALLAGVGSRKAAVTSLDVYMNDLSTEDKKSLQQEMKERAPHLRCLM